MNVQEWEHMVAQARFVCNHPEKKKYATRKLAEEYINRNKKKSNVELRVYKCKFCNLWHLTSH